MALHSHPLSPINDDAGLDYINHAIQLNVGEEVCRDDLPQQALRHAMAFITPKGALFLALGVRELLAPQHVLLTGRDVHHERILTLRDYGFQPSEAVN